MVRVLIGDLFKSRAQTLVNTVNCVGVMGKGVALQFKKLYPDMYKEYVSLCKRGEVKLGRPYLYKSLFNHWVLNFPTKDHWRSVSNINDIIRGLNYLVSNYKQWGIASIALPPLGCGQGQLDWKIVGPTMYRILSQMAIPVELYAPAGTPEEELEATFLSSNKKYEPVKFSSGSLALIEILYRLEQQPYHWPIGRTSFQKMAFVATKEGIPTGLTYRRGSYGPFSPELKQLITKFVNHGLIKEKRSGKMFIVQVGPTFIDIRCKLNFQKWDAIINKITDLFSRMDTSQAEIASTVIYAANELINANNRYPTELEVLKSVMDWKQRRRPPINPDDVACTIRNLAILDWLKVKPSEDLSVAMDSWLC